METEELTAEDLYQAIMAVWERKTREEIGDHARRVAEKQPTGDQRGEKAA